MAATTKKVVVFLLLVVAGAEALRSGAGIADVTGPVTEIPFMGYAFPNQTGEGLHYRLYARAFVFVDDAGNRFAYVSADICMGFYGIKMKVVEGLQAVFGDLYGHHNVMLSGTHTHSGPGALSWFLLYDISMLGRDKKHFDAVVQGVVLSIVRAHNNLSPTTTDIFMQQGLLYNASGNRSPSSYLANPQSERDFYARWGGDTDKNMTVLHLRNASGPTGSVAFFAVHGTSMHNSNRLVSGDNKGHASSIFEKNMNGNSSLLGRGPFVAAFGQSNEGDVTPNILGAWCYGRVGGIYCNDNRSLCDGKNEHCVSVGPAGFDDDYNSCRLIGERQAARAQALFASAPQQGVKIDGSVTTAFKWVNLSNITVSALYTSTGEVGHTCRPAVGDSFAAGTTDGPGAFNFYQGDNCSTCLPFWNFIKNFLKKPTKEQIACQAPKPILLDVGEIEPHPWVPSVLPLQLVKMGSFVIAAVPAEFTTMAGRRLRRTIEGVFAQHSQPVTVVIAGLANGYTQYVATYEEYQYQRYEAASTLYGPHTLAAYQQEFASLAEAIATGATVDPGSPAINLSYVNFHLQPGVVVDTHPAGESFGSVATDRPSNTYRGGDTVNVTFWGANLRNDYLQGSSYMEVQRLVGTAWVTVLDDANWETKVHWKRKDVSQSLITVEWNIAPGTQPGTYRLLHRGYAKPEPLSHKLVSYVGTSKSFDVTA